jgi:hypothetical protein
VSAGYICLPVEEASVSSSCGLLIGIYTFYGSGSTENSSMEERRWRVRITPTNARSEMILEVNHYGQISRIHSIDENHIQTFMV